MMKGKNLLIISSVFLFISFNCLLSFADIVSPFSGEIDLSDENFTLNLDLEEKGSLTLNIKKSPNDIINVVLKVDHILTPFFDISSEINSEIQFFATDKHGGYKNIIGKVGSRYSLINYKPVNDLSGRFEVADKKLKVQSFSFGNLVLNGYMELYYPYKLNFMVRIASIDMDDFLNFWVLNKGYNSSGDVYGIIKASGNLNRLFLEGNLQSQDGFIKGLNYNTIDLKILGFYPKMSIHDSSISKDDGTSFLFSGPFDLSDRENFKKQIMSLTLAPIISSKDEEMKWIIKRLKGKDDDSTLELKYLLKQDGGEGVSGKGPSALLGVEKIYKF